VLARTGCPGYSELELMQATEVERQQRAIAVGLSADASWEKIAQGEGNRTSSGAGSPNGAADHGDDDGEFHDVDGS